MVCSILVSCEAWQRSCEAFPAVSPFYLGCWWWVAVSVFLADVIAAFNLARDSSRPDLMLKYNFRTFWSDKHRGDPAMLPLINAADAATELTQSVGAAGERHCVEQGCSPGRLDCRHRQLLQDLLLAFQAFEYKMALKRPRDTVVLGQASSPAVILRNVSQALIASLHQFSQPAVAVFADCAPVLYNYLDVAELIAKICLEMQSALFQLNGILLARRVAAPPAWLHSLRFDPVGSNCFGGLHGCQERVEIARVLLAHRESPFIAEIGAFEGDFGIGLVESIPKLQVLAVDPHQPDWDPNADGRYERVIGRAAPFRDRYHLISQTSENVSNWVANGTLDLVFIDGDHSYQSCSADVRGWVPKLKKGGTVLIHDYDLVHPGIIRCTHEAVELWADGPPHIGTDFMVHFNV